MNISFEIPEPYDIPQIIHGLSANTLFFLINFEKVFKDKAFEGEQNMTHPSLPYDLDDFSRIMNAYNVFKWTPEDIEEAKKTVKKLKFAKKFKIFLDNFLVLKTFYEGGEEDEEDFKELLREINNGTLKD